MATRTRKIRRRGFTLLELVLVMLIISIAMAIIVPSLGNTARGRRVGDTAAQIVSLCNYARTQSIAEGRPYRLNFDTGAGAYWLTVQDGGKFDELGSEIGRQHVVADDLRLQTDLDKQADGTYVTFGLNGRVDPAPVSVRIVDADGGSAQVVCESATELFHVLPRDKR